MRPSFCKKLSVSFTSSSRRTISMKSNVVETAWLKSNLSSVNVLDCSWHMPASKRKGSEEFKNEHIPSALFFDLDECCDKSTDLPHNMPSTSEFSAYLKQIGASNEKPFVVYDTHGVFSAARTWFMLKAFGFEVSLLNGGLPAWKRDKLDVQSGAYSSPSSSTFTSKDPSKRLILCDAIAKLVTSGDEVKKGEIVVIDARSAERFKGEVPEPRPGLNRGHITNSRNVPFSSLLESIDGVSQFKKPESLKKVFQDAGVNLGAKKFIFSCGSGVTACVPMLALVEFLNIPFEYCLLYDGSFSEWGKPELNLPTSKV